MIRIELFGHLRKTRLANDFKAGELALPEGSTLNDMLSLLQVPLDLPIVILVNGQLQPFAQPLNDGDEIQLLPPVDGG